MTLRLYTADEAGRDGYPLEWHRSIKHLVREQAGHRCVRCGHPYRNGEHGKGEWSPCDERCTHDGPLRHVNVVGPTVELPPENVSPDSLATGRVLAQWRILTVHHANGNKLDCRWWNLLALCQRCHLQIQGKVDLDRPWPWEHSEWFRPYVAGYYAWKHLGLELTRDETEARIDELLTLGARLASVERMPL